MDLLKKYPWIILVLVVVVAGGIYLVASDSSDETESANTTPQVISPAGYEDEFVASEKDHTLLDVRTPEEYAAGHIAGSSNINVEVLASRLDEVPRDKPVVVYCRSGNRSATAANILDEAGYTNVYDLGGIIAWVEAGYPVQQ
jgi:rhodanese-related sulfurtransferase